MILEEVYDQKQFDNLDSLRKAMREGVDKINWTKIDWIENFNRLLKVLDNRGDEISYYF